MKRRKIPVLECIVILVIIGILTAILFPVFQRRAWFDAAIIPPQHFENVELQTVMVRLDQALQTSRARQGKKPVDWLKATWQTKQLKHRLVSFDTQQALPLKKVLFQIEHAAHVKLDFGGWCGTCGSPMGRVRIKDDPPGENPKPQASNFQQGV